MNIAELLTEDFVYPALGGYCTLKDGEVKYIKVGVTLRVLPEKAMPTSLTPVMKMSEESITAAERKSLLESLKETLAERWGESKVKEMAHFVGSKITTVQMRFCLNGGEWIYSPPSLKEGYTSAMEEPILYEYLAAAGYASERTHIESTSLSPTMSRKIEAENDNFATFYQTKSVRRTYSGFEFKKGLRVQFLTISGDVVEFTT